MAQPAPQIGQGTSKSQQPQIVQQQAPEQPQNQFQGMNFDDWALSSANNERTNFRKGANGLEYNYGDEGYGAWDPKKAGQSWQSGIGNFNPVERAYGEYVRNSGGDRYYGLTKEEASKKKADDLRTANVKYAQEFRSGIPLMENKLVGSLGNQLNQQMGEGLRSTREGAASRGLMNSGLRVKSEEGVRSGTKKAFASGAQSIKRGLLSQADSLDKQAIDSGIAIQQNEQAMNDAIYQQALAQMNAEMGAWGSLLGAGAQAGTMYALGMFSDRRLKENIRYADSDIEDFLSHITPYEYNYKGTHIRKVSVMAQDLEKSKIGQRMVVDTPQGKIVDYGAGLESILASVAYIHKKLKMLENQ